MAFSLAGANVPALSGDWFNPGLTPRMTGKDQTPAPFPVLNVRNNSATPTARGNTVNLFIDSESEEIEFAASIITACVDHTVYAIQCTKAPASIGTNCGPDGQEILTITEGSAVYQWDYTATTRTMGYDVTASLVESCSLAGTTAATCVGTAGGEAAGTKTSKTAVVTIASPTYYRFDVEITGGADKTKNPSPTCGAKGAATSLNAKTMAIWALTGTFGVASLLSML
ncbi:hypothetical protein VC83_06531 [Pseudogymnoascus destructans]|uniref:Uncharacterized protein n=2 Tax=Pseudogymnoascus destructans TaxID=655981 RepID=L8FXW0_PSED2|nr:uncharacterized protein VC83_06531 [Pseudogymnoascus destructans]ELR05338.1 hypothetical protein GMDG_07321 [Pseudogymnoascus destructans 20631-21]OAF58380.1 hypothetical protein VC83_06531 [Pseudogymnoascus destructans]